MKDELSRARSQIVELTTLSAEYRKQINQSTENNKVLKTQFKNSQNELDQMTAEKNNTQNIIRAH